MTASKRSELLIAKFMRTLSAAALALARELEQEAGTEDAPQLRLENAGLGTLQLAVANTMIGADPGEGLSPRQITNAIQRSDEPNVRSALSRLSDRGVAELVPDVPTHRWRLTNPYRPEGDAQADV